MKCPQCNGELTHVKTALLAFERCERCKIRVIYIGRFPLIWHEKE